MTAKPKILLVDDDFDLRLSLAEAFGDEFDVVTAGTGAEALVALEARAPEAIITDVRMPEMDGIEFLATVRSKYPEMPIIIVSGYAEKEMLIGAVRFQAFDFFEKPVDYQTMAGALRRAVDTHRYHMKLSALRSRLDLARTEVEQHAQALRALYADSDYVARESPPLPSAFDSILTQNGGMRARLAYCAAIAGTSLPVLVTGEVGTGKDRLARAIHGASGRQGAFVAVDVRDLERQDVTEDLIEAAADGTIFMEEIGDLTASRQIRLLRLLESGEYSVSRSATLKQSTARIIASTNKDMSELVARGIFRPDVYFRLKAHLIEMPPLRERKDDLPLLLDHFFSEAALKLTKAIPTYPKELLVLLANYRFPGNLDELREMIGDAVARHPGGVLSMRTFQDRMLPEDAVRSAARPRPSETGLNFEQMEQLPTLRDVEELLVKEALRRAQGNQAIAARLLGMTRQALNKRLVREGQKKVG